MIVYIFLWALIFIMALCDKRIHVGYAIVISSDEEEDSGSDDLPNVKYPRYAS